MNEWSRKDYPTPESSPEVKQESPEAPSSLSPPASFNSTSPSSPLESALVRYSNGLQIKSEAQPKRTTPCQQCRRIRRACKWIEGDEDCERCGKLGKQCTGPTRRSKSTIELVRPAHQQQLKTVVAAIGPSSPETRWSTLHMSYSLTYHLVETGLDFLAAGFVYDGFDYNFFYSRLQDSRGRLDEIDSVDQLFSMAQMIAGSHSTTHSAFLQTRASVIDINSLDVTRSDPVSWTEVGLARRGPILSVTRQIAKTLESQSFDHDTPELASERMSVCLFALRFISDLQEFAPDQLMLLQDIVRKGVDYLARSEASISLDEHESFCLPLREIAREEIRVALVLDRPTTISPSQYYRLFGQHQLFAIPAIPDDISYIFSMPPESPETRELAFDFQDSWIPFPFPLYNRLEYILAYTPTQKLSAAIQYCWKRLTEITTQIGKMIEKILSDSRYRKEDARPRPRACLGNLVQVESDSLFLLKSCHNALARSPSAVALFERSEQLWFSALARSTERLVLVPNFCNSRPILHAACADFVERLRLCPSKILIRWALLFPSERDSLIVSLRFVSHGMPDACRLIRILETSAS